MLARSELDSTQLNREMGVVEHRLTVYVIQNCANCEYAMSVAAAIRRDYPQVAVEVVDLANPSEPVPDSVFATPTYLLDGRVWSLGNPSPEQIEAKFGKAAPYQPQSPRKLQNSLEDD